MMTGAELGILDLLNNKNYSLHFLSSYLTASGLFK